MDSLSNMQSKYDLSEIKNKFGRDQYFTHKNQ